jgi:hypothetical protein
MSIDNLRYLPVSSGTIVLNGAQSQNLQDVELKTTSLILFSLNTVGGTPAGSPYVFSFTNLGAFNAAAQIRTAAGDTSTYNWVVFNPRP